MNFIDNKYEFQIFCINPQINIKFYNTDLLYSDILSNIEKINMSDSLFDIDGNSNNVFSYNTLKNRKLPCFRNINCEKIKINYKNNKYKCNFEFSNPFLKLSFNFNDLNFFEKDNELLTTAKILILSNFTINTLEKYNSIENIELNNIIINNQEVITKIHEKYIDDFKIKKLIINYTDNKYVFQAFCTNSQLNFSFYNTDLLYSDHFLNINEINISDSIFDIDGNSNNVFPIIL